MEDTTDHTVKLASFVALRSTTGVFRLACAELSKVLSRLGGDIGEELHL